MKNWLYYTGLVGFAVYWASNLLLWFPWSIDPTLGITLMLTVSPLIWAYAAYCALVKYPGAHMYTGAAWTGLVFLLLAILMDLIFFGWIREALTELLHPTTFYGYGFVLALPFLLVLLMGKRRLRNKREVSKSDGLRALAVGIGCLLALTAIIGLGIELS